MRMVMLHVMVISAMVVSFFFADAAPFGCCSRGYQPPVNNNSNPDKEKAGEENPKTGRLQFQMKRPKQTVATTVSKKKHTQQASVCKDTKSL